MKRNIFILLILAFLSVLVAEPVEDPNEPQSSSAGSIDGVGDTTWGSSFESLREHFIKLQQDPKNPENVEIVHEIYNKRLHVRRNGIDYFYRFYSTPKLVKANRAPSPERKAENDKLGKPSEYGASLYSVGIKFNNIESIILKEKLMEKYGTPSKQIKDITATDEDNDEEEQELALVDDKKETTNQPENSNAPANVEPQDPAAIPAIDAKKERNYVAFIWDKSDKSRNRPEDTQKKLSGTYIVQWNEPYSKNRYTRRLDYFSAEITESILKDYKDYYSAREDKTLADLLKGLGAVKATK